MSEPSYDKEKVYDEEIAPLMDRVISICKREGIPMVATFCYRNNKDEDGQQSFCTTSLDDGKGWKPEKIEEATSIILTNKTQAVAFTITTKEP